MRKAGRWAAGFALAAALTVGACGASAQAANISVRVDDQPVAFTDVRPVIKNDRTFVPFRAIFEQMGAKVSWDGNTRTVIAERDGREVRLTIGDPVVRIAENGEQRTMKTDAAAWILNDRTVIPVRFAAQALGACVDWHAESATVLIVDTAKQMKDYADKFTHMDQYLALTEQDGARAVDGGFTWDLNYHTAMGNVPVGMKGTITGAESRDAASLHGTVTTDTTALRAAVEKNEGKHVIDAEIEALLEKLRNQKYETIVSRVDDTLYLRSAMLTELGVPATDWAALPLGGLFGEGSADLLTAAVNGSFADYVAASVQKTALRDAPQQTVQTVRAAIEKFAADYGDDNFRNNGQTVDLRQPTEGGETLLRLYYGLDGKVSQAELMSSMTAPDGARAEISALQTAGSMTLTVVSKGGKTLEHQLKVEMKMLDAVDRPAVRPEGKTVPVKL